MRRPAKPSRRRLLELIRRRLRHLVQFIEKKERKPIYTNFEDEMGDQSNIEFINLIINQLVEYGIVAVSLLYESPFTDVAYRGPEAIFTAEQIQKFIRLLDDIECNGDGSVVRRAAGSTLQESE